jgi:hypothetical protein
VKLRNAISLFPPECLSQRSPATAPGGARLILMSSWRNLIPAPSPPRRDLRPRRSEPADLDPSPGVGARRRRYRLSPSTFWAASACIFDDASMPVLDVSSRPFLPHVRRSSLIAALRGRADDANDHDRRSAEDAGAGAVTSTGPRLQAESRMNPC